MKATKKRSLEATTVSLKLSSVNVMTLPSLPPPAPPPPLLLELLELLREEEPASPARFIVFGVLLSYLHNK